MLVSHRKHESESQEPCQITDFDEHMICSPGSCGHFGCSGLSSYKKNESFDKNTFLEKIGVWDEQTAGKT